MAGEPDGVLFAGVALFFQDGDDFAVVEQRDAGVVGEGDQAEDAHSGGSRRRSVEREV